MSDTPRTKAISALINRLPHLGGEAYYAARDAVMADVETMEEELTAARSQIAALESQLPESMKHCFIEFKECSRGHGTLTAKNLVQHDCFICRAELAEKRLAEIENAGIPGAPNVTYLFTGTDPWVREYDYAALRTFALRQSAELAQLRKAEIDKKVFPITLSQEIFNEMKPVLIYRYRKTSPDVTPSVNSTDCFDIYKVDEGFVINQFGNGYGRYILIK